MTDHLVVLIERRNWLRERIKAKRSLGWDVTWDEREYAALCWAVEKLRERNTPEGINAND